MEEERVGLALAKATDLRLKFSSCIDKATASQPKQNLENQEDPNSHQSDEEEDDDETERLLNIRDALESLEAQLVALQSTNKSLANGVTTGDLTNGAKKNLNEHEQSKKQYESKNSRKGLGYFFSSAVKIVLPLVGAICILSFSGFVPNLGKANPPKFLGTLQHRSPEENNSTVQCPPGKVLVMENGEARCLVKERIEVPFESIVTKPDVNYGSG
ncbi:hypothetical protein PTKIN_Ptkin10aG0184100 [Pterospermum kingtungense]